MINTQLTSQIASAQKELKNENSTSNKDKLSSKETLTASLKQNLGLERGHRIEELVENSSKNQLNEKLKELVNKLLEQINAGKNPNSAVLKQSKDVNFAPNFANELKILSTELAKSDTYKQILEKLNEIIKPASEIKTERFAPLLKNSGIFFETKLKDALNQETLPKSFHLLLSTIKTLSDEKISDEISKLAFANLSPKESLNTLQNIITNSKNENKQILNQSAFRILFNLSSKIENFKNYINKNPSQAQEKILSIANKVLKQLRPLKNETLKTLGKAENLVIENTKILRQSIASFEKLENTLKNILQKAQSNKHTQGINAKTQENLQDLAEKAIQTQKEGVKIDAKQEFQKTHSKEQIEQEHKHILGKEVTEKSQTKALKNEMQTQKFSMQQIEVQNHTNNQELHKALDETKQTQESKQEKLHEEGSNVKEKTNEFKKESLKELSNKTNDKNEFSGKTAQNISTQSQQNSSTQNQNQLLTNEFFQKEQEITKENSFKNFAFSDENLDFEEAQLLSKDLNKLSKKLNESLKQLEPNTHNAKVSLEELKNLNHKLELSLKDLSQIKIKTEQDISLELQNDVKSTLLQISNLAKNEANEAIYSQTNRLLAQIELNQLLSLANDSVNTYLPFFWEDLNDSKIIFKRGKKNKFFTQIKLEFAKLGKLEILISLSNEKYIDINIMAENKEFRKNIYENAYELKRAINKAGLLSANFFVGTLIRSKFDKTNLRTYDLEMGMDKKV